MANKKEFTLLVNGVEKSTENVEKLGNSLEKVDVKAKGMSVTAKDVADTYKNELKDVIEYFVLQMAKIEAIITELSTHAGQAIEKNIRAGEKLAKSMEMSGEGVLSSIESTVTKLPAIVTEGYERMMANLGNISGTQSSILEEQLKKNKELIDTISEESLTSIATKYSDQSKKIGIINLEAHKKNVKGHVEELNKFKTELQHSVEHTRKQYDAVCLSYDKDSEEFKKAQENKTEELKKLEAKITEVNKEIKKQNDSYLGVWNKQHDEIKTKLDDFSKKDGGLDKFIKKNTYGFETFVDNFGKGIGDLQTSISTLETKEKAANDEKYKKKIEKLDKELAEVKTETTKYEKEKAQAEKEKKEATEKAEKYRNDIKKIEDSFKIKNPNADEKKEDADKPEESTNTLQSLTAEIPANADSESKDSSEKNDVAPVADASEEEIKAAYERIEELDKLAKAEEEIVENKQTTIENANNRITESNRSVLLEQMRIEDEQQKLKEEKEKKDAEIAEKAQKKRDKLEKLEKIKAKAQLVLDIVKATKDIAAGVAKAWAYGPFIGPPMAALVALNGAMQLRVMTAQLAKFADGGLLNGKRHTQGGMRIEGTNMEVEGGEYVINRESTDKNIGLIRYINTERRQLTPADINAFFASKAHSFEPSFRHAFAQGGQLPVIETPANIDNDSLVKAIQSIKIEPKVAVTDIHKVQDNMVSVSGWSGV